MTSVSLVTLKMSEAELSTTSTSNPRDSESFSVFGDGSCGEPLVAQHLVVDFTPVEDMDNDFVQRKCCAFWDFISSRPELHDMMAKPDSTIFRKEVEVSEKSSEAERSVESEPEERLRTAVSMLEIVEDKGLIDRIFEAKLPQSQCSLGSRTYVEDDRLAAATPYKQDTAVKCVCSGACNMCSEYQNEVTIPSSPRVTELSKTMQEWDNQHPKSMEPPGHPPALSQGKMQRNL